MIKFFPNGSYRLSIKFLAVGMFLKGSPGIKTCMGGGGGALISIVFGFLPKHNSENKILIRYHIVWLLVDFQSKGSKRRDARLS